MDFTLDVEPILTKYCYMCHGPEVSMNGYSMWRRKSALRGGYSGRPAIEPGNSAGSRLIDLVSGKEENLLMPPAGGPLEDREIDLLRSWIDQGVYWRSEDDTPEEVQTTEWLDMDYGGVISASITVHRPEDPRADKEPGDNIAYKAHAISLTPDEKASVLFDTQLLRYAAGRTGGFLVLTGTVFDWMHGPHPYADGQPVFETPVEPGWAQDGDFSDPRPSGFGPLPRSWGHYKGRYVYGRRNILSYSIGTVEILDMPSFERSQDLEVFVRTLEVGPSSEDLLLEVAASSGSRPSSQPEELQVARLGGLLAAANGAEATWALNVSGHLRLRIPAAKMARSLSIYLSDVPVSRTSEFVQWVRHQKPLPSLREFTGGGPARFPQTLETRGILAKGSEPWVVDEITLPFENPWKSWMRPGDFGFFQDDRAAITTWSGDVWIVEGVDEDLDPLRWQRYATGLYQPLGIEVVGEAIYVLDRNQVTRLHDLNGDGEADFYENFNSDFAATHHFHEFTFDLDRDPAGNFYFAKAARHALPAKVRHHGTIMKLDPEGRELEVVCNGFRVPNGVAISPEGHITTSDQEGHWIPSTPIAWCTPGSYHGYAWGGVDPARADDYSPPVTYLPIEVDNSGAGQAWVPSSRWGPFEGQLVHASYGRGKLYIVLIEEAEGIVQGGAYQLPLYLDTGLMRPAFRSSDGQLYVCGLRGWGTTTKSTGGFYRVRYTGRPVTLPVELHVNREDGITIQFNRPLDHQSATDTSRYYLRRWNYQRSSRYGSEKFRLDNQQGTETVQLRSAKLSENHETLFLEPDDLREVNQMMVGIDIIDAEGEPVVLELFHSINQISKTRGRAIRANFR